MSRTLIARTLSVIGHPALLMPASIAAAARMADAPPPLLRLAVGSAVAVAAIVGVFSLWQVHTGRWRHVDASLPGERRQLTRLLAALLCGIAVLAWASGQAPPVAAGPLLVALPVLAAHALRGRMKLSLHAAYAALAAPLLWPQLPLVAAAVLLALAVSWSRLQLRRHTRTEVLAGLLLGAGAGALLRALLS
jgi:membrane-associated phospholipid phosphatase